VEHADAVSRVAINLRGVPRDGVHRGDTLTRPGDWRGVASLDVRLSEPGRLPAQMIYHIGSAAVPTRIRPLGEDTVRLTLDRPVVCALGERGILLDPGGRRMVGDPAALPAEVGDDRDAGCQTDFLDRSLASKRRKRRTSCCFD